MTQAVAPVINPVANPVTDLVTTATNTVTNPVTNTTLPNLLRRPWRVIVRAARGRVERAARGGLPFEAS